MKALINAKLNVSSVVGEESWRGELARRVYRRIARNKIKYDAQRKSKER
jgi:hypothetical protein